MLRESHHHIRRLARPYLNTVPGAKVGIVFIHGFADSPYSMRSLANVCMENGYTVAGIRLPGHGVRLKDFEQARLEDWLQAVSRALDGMAARTPKVVVVARSFGGVLAFLAIASGRHHVDGVFTMGTPHRIHAQRILRWMVPILAIVKRTVRKPWAKREDAIERDEVGRYRRFPTKVLQQFFRGMEHMRPDILRKIHTPLLIVQGQRDELSPSTSPSFYLENVSSIEKSILWVEGVTHNAHELNTHPDVVRSLLRFLERRAAR